MDFEASTSPPRWKLEKWITRAYQGDIQSLSLIVAQLKFTPAPLLVLFYDLLKLFTFYMQKHDDIIQSEDYIILSTSAALFGLDKLVKSETYKEDMKYRDYLYQNWYKSLDYTHHVLSIVREKGIRGSIEQYLFQTIRNPI